MILTLYFIFYVYRSDIFRTKDQNVYLSIELLRNAWMCDVVLKFSLGNKILT